MDPFTFVKRGYEPEEVDKYIATLEQVIKSYKDKDNAIKNAIISAQMAADDVVRNAKSEAESYKVQIGEQLVGMRATLDRQRMSIQNLQDAYTNVIRKCMQELESFNMDEMFARINEMEKAIMSLQSLEAANKENLLPGPSQDMPRESRPYPRDTMPETPMREHDMREPRDREPRERDYMRDPAPMRDNRDVMRQGGAHAPAIRDTRDRDMRHDMMAQAPREAMLQQPQRETMLQQPPRDVIRDIAMDMPRRSTPAPHSPQEIMRDTRDRDMMPRDVMPRDMLPASPYAPQEPMRDSGRDVMRDTGREPMRDTGHDMMRDTGRDYAPEPSREIIRDTRRDSRNDFGRDVRRDYGRDMRSEAGRDTRRDDYSRDPMGRLDSREPMRDMGRQYAPPETDGYDDDQNLLPPVASLM